ncbi:hypothetical protein Tcan_12279 [Toxocara canis]|uniref:Uncharacterized protein n=1 Tax=Toxocara canis TaxID=6265 RepID=A0A0B2VH41_TOXCA|nr:hypothetical protein Tcan_12279 [Toxocara canis]
MALPNVFLSLFLTHEFREYIAVLNPRFNLSSLSDGPLQVIKEKIVREVEGSVGASVTFDIWSGKCIKDSFIAATIHYGLKASGCSAQVDALMRVVRRFGKTQLKTRLNGFMQGSG